MFGLNADLVGILFGNFEARLLHRLIGGRDRILDEGVHLFDVALFDPVFRDKVVDFTGDARGKFRGVEARDRSDSGAARHQRLPVLLDSDPERGHQTNSGDHDAALKHSSHQARLPPSAFILCALAPCAFDIIIYQKAVPVENPKK